MVLAPLGLRLAEAKTRTVHIDEGFDFLGFRIQRQPKRGSGMPTVYTYPSWRAGAPRTAPRYPNFVATTVAAHRPGALDRAGGVLGTSGERVSNGTADERTRPSWTVWRRWIASSPHSAAMRTRLPGMAARW